MKPKELKLTNLRSLTDFTYTYSSGITGVKGPNFTGKSNFADIGQKFAWPGTTPSGINKKDLLNWYADKGNTKFTFEHNDCTYSLTRNIHNAKVSLVKINKDGETTTYTDSTEVQETLEEMTGISLDLISEYCFISQFNLTAVLQMTRSQRMDYFLRLVGGDKASRIRSKLQTIANRIPVYRDRSEEIANNEKDLEAANKEYEGLIGEKKNLTSRLNEIEEQTREANKLLSHPVESVIQKQIEEIDSKLKANKNKHDEFIKTSDLTPVEECKPLTDNEKAFIYYKENVEEELQTSLDALNKLKAPTKVEDPQPLKEDLLSIKNKYNSEKKKIENIEKGVCPECERPYDVSEEDLKKRREELLEMKEDFTTKKSRYETALKEYTSYTEAVEIYNRQKTKLETEIENLRKQVPSDTDLDYNTVKSKQQQYNKYCAYLNAVNTNKEKLDKFSEERVRLESEKKSLEKQETITLEQKKEAEEIIRKKSDVTDELNELNIKIERISERKNNYISSIEKMRKEQEECEKNEKFIEFLQETRNIFHKDSLPSLVLEDRRRSLNYHLADYLEYVNSGFTAYIDDTFDFRVNFENGQSERPVGDLSGGQKIMLSIVFHLAKLNLLPQVPFLVLDEPTMYLNREVISDISRIFEKFSRDCQKNGQPSYIMIPTHENELDSCFTRVYEMRV